MPNMKSTVGAQQKTATTWTRDKKKPKTKTKKKTSFNCRKKDECPLDMLEKNNIM